MELEEEFSVKATEFLFRMYFTFVDNFISHSRSAFLNLFTLEEPVK
jgi:hypothetical protein